MPEELERSRHARAAAESALVRIVHHYGGTPEFVVLGGLVPDLLCAGSGYVHAGTTDVDVQVNLEIASGSVHAQRLERALVNAEFNVDGERAWRWRSADYPLAVVKFELLADLDNQPAGATVMFPDCDDLGAANLRGTGFATQDFLPMTISARIHDHFMDATIRISGLAGFLLAKAAAARGRSKPKDWYDIAFVLLHNDYGGPRQAAERVIQIFGDQGPTISTDLEELLANFADGEAQGPRAYAEQFVFDHPDENFDRSTANAVAAVNEFVSRLRQT